MKTAKSVVKGRTQAGKADRFSELYLQYHEKVYQKCLSMLKDPIVAQDAAQEIFIQVYVKWSSFREESRPSTWLFAITRNYCLDQIRKQARQLEKEQQLLLEDVMDDPNAAASKPEMAEQKISDMHRVLEQLPYRDHRILMMKFRDRLPIKKIARKIRTSEGAVKMRILRAKAKAKQLQWQLAG